MKKSKKRIARFLAAAGLALFLIIAGNGALSGQSLDFPAKNWGISFGNSKEFSGLRFNFRDSRVQRISGINVTFWQPRKDNTEAIVRGLSLGVIPGGGYLSGIQIGLLGVASDKNLAGISIGGLGVGSGGDVIGINIGGLGAGAGETMSGLNLGGLGMGAGKNLVGINIGGLGAGAGENMTGLNIGGLGVGAGEDLIGINIGGIGAGAGRNMKGLNIGGIGAGAGEDVQGITIGGIAAGAGENMTGLNIGGVAVGAGNRLVGVNVGGIAVGGKEVQGLNVAGIAVGGEVLKGIHLSSGTVLVTKNGRMVGFAASPFNYIRGNQTGLSIGIVNYAWSLRGVQLGLINIVRDNPKGLKVLPVFNAGF